MQGLLREEFSRISTRAILCEKSRENAVPQDHDKTAAHTLCEPAHLKCTSASHKIGLCENLQVKKPATDGATWSSGLNSYRKNLSVWTGRLGGKNMCKSNCAHIIPMPGSSDEFFIVRMMRVHLLSLTFEQLSKTCKTSARKSKPFHCKNVA